MSTKIDPMKMSTSFKFRSRKNYMNIADKVFLRFSTIKENGQFCPSFRCLKTCFAFYHFLLNVYNLAFMLCFVHINVYKPKHDLLPVLSCRTRNSATQNPSAPATARNLLF